MRKWKKVGRILNIANTLSKMKAQDRWEIFQPHSINNPKLNQFRSCSDPEVDRDSADIHDTETELDDDDLDDDCFLEDQSSQDTKSLR